MNPIDVLGANLLELLPLCQQGQAVPLERHPLTQALVGQANQTNISEFRRATHLFLLDIFSRQIEFTGQQLSAVLVIRDVTACHQLEQRQAIQFSMYTNVSASRHTERSNSKDSASHLSKRRLGVGKALAVRS